MSSVFRKSRLAGVLLLVVALGSCADTTGPSDTPLGAILAQFTAVESYFATGLGRGNAVEVGPSGDMPNACVFSAASAKFVCPEVTISGVSVKRSYQLLSSGALPLASFDATTVAAIRVTSEASGVVTTPGSFCCPSTVTSFTSSGDATYGGLISGSRVINGTRTTVASFTRSGKTTTSTSVLTIANIAPPLTSADVQASAGFGFPMSGKVTSAVTGVDTLGAAFTSQVETTFNGTPIVTTVVAKGGTTTTYTCTYSRSTSGASTSIFVSCEQS